MSLPTSRWLQTEPELGSCSTNPIVQAEEFHARDTGSSGQCRREMNRVKRPDWFNRKRASRPVHNVCVQSEHVPVRRCRVQVGAPITRSRLVDLPERHGADEHAIALEQCQIGSDHELRFGENLSYR